MRPEVKKNLFVIAGMPALLALAVVLVVGGGHLGAFFLIKLLTIFGIL